MTSDVSPSVNRAAERAKQSPFFLAATLDRFQDAQNMETGELARFLGCPAAQLPRLALCRRPRSESTTFFSDIQHLSQRFGINEENLLNVLRFAEALEALQAQQGTQIRETGSLLAARDRETDEKRDDAGDEQ